MTGGVTAALLVGVGGATGAVARHLVGIAVRSQWSIFMVNAAGTLLLGVLLGAAADDGTALLVGVGFCGAFTTFSSFTVETVTTAERVDAAVAAVFAVANLVGALIGLSVGVAFGGIAF